MVANALREAAKRQSAREALASLEDGAAFGPAYPRGRTDRQRDERVLVDLGSNWRSLDLDVGRSDLLKIWRRPLPLARLAA